MAKLLKQIFGWVLLVFGLIGFATEIDDASQGKATNRTVGVVLSSLCLGGGALLLVSAWKTRPAPKPHLPSGASAEDLVLDLARIRKGRITATEAAAETPLEFQEAKQELERLVLQGACLAEVSSEGLMVYRFPEYEDETPG